MNAQDIAKKIAESKASNGGNWIKQGSGVLICKTLILGGKERFYKGDTFLAELFVESSQSIPGAVTEKGEPEIANPPGTTVTFRQGLAENPETAYGNTKAFLLNLLDETEETLAASGTAQGRSAAEELAAVIVGVTDEKANPCRGMRIRYETFVKISEKRKIRLVLPKWSPFKGQNAETIAQARTLLDGATSKAA